MSSKIIEVELYETEKLINAIKSLPYASKISDKGPMVFIPESDYGFAEIYRMYDTILVFLIPQYGGTPGLVYNYGLHAIESLVKKIQES